MQPVYGVEKCCTLFICIELRYDCMKKLFVQNNKNIYENEYGKLSLLRIFRCLVHQLTDFAKKVAFLLYIIKIHFFVSNDVLCTNGHIFYRNLMFLFFLKRTVQKVFIEFNYVLSSFFLMHALLFVLNFSSNLKSCSKIKTINFILIFFTQTYIKHTN